MKREQPITHHDHGRLGYSKKGWTDCELAVLWLKHFDGYTKKKANGQTRLLIVDGHNSHYSFEFLDYARTQQIHVLCYPAHTTHVYQGLDVVVFSVLKRHWAEEKTRWEENGGEVTKETFLEVYGRAHIKTLTPELIQKAFEKTGISPFNPDIIPPEMMAPSKETSLEGPLPLAPSTPIRTAAASLHSLLHPSSEQDQHPLLLGQQSRGDVTNLIECTIHQLEDPELRYLTRTSPIKASALRPPVTTTTISPIKAHYASLLSTNPETDQEKALTLALHNLTLREAHYKGIVAGLQSSVILQQAYVERVHGQLEAKERKGQNEKGALRGGHARLMTEDEVFNEIKVQKEERAEQKLAKEKRKGMMEEYRIAMEGWKKGEEARKVWNATRREEWGKEVQTWKGLPKPKGKQPLLGKLNKAKPKPIHPTSVAADEDEVRPPWESFASRCLTRSNRTLLTTVTVTCDTRRVTLFRGVTGCKFGAVPVWTLWRGHFARA